MAAQYVRFDEITAGRISTGNNHIPRTFHCPDKTVKIEASLALRFKKTFYRWSELRETLGLTALVS